MRPSILFLVSVSLFATAEVAHAHISLASGPAAAGKSQKITFGVGHGCDGADTVEIRVEIPAGISGVLALASDFGKPEVEKTGTAVTAVTWKKAEADFQNDDIQYYEITLRARVDAPAFTTVVFPVIQTCRKANGDRVEVRWVEAPGGQGEPAPLLIVTPARVPGWNKFTIPAGTTVKVADLPTYFGDALIVWRGTAAFTTNANTMTMIEATPGVTPLAADLVASDVIWVKY